jgi:transcriptional regulator with XRE-family HTH domain/lipopolysaccharide biosynthesis regulator YciM
MAVRQARSQADPEARTAVGARIRALRLERGLSQAQVAEGMLSASYVSLVESGRRQPASSALGHIAERLGVDTGFLRDGIDAEARRRDRLALGRAEAALNRGDVDDAFRRFVELEGSPGLGEEQQRQVRMGRAMAAERRGDLEGALRVLSELADEARRAPAVHPWMDVAEALCRCYREAGDLDLAISTGEEAMRHATELGLEASDEYVRLGCTVLAAYQERGDLAKATLVAADMVRMADAMGAPQTRGAAYWNASLVAESRGEIGQALQLVDRAVAMFGESDDRRNLARLRVAYAWLLLQQHPPEAERALELLDSVRSGLVEHAGSVDVGSCDTERARALLALGRTDEAREAAEQSLAGLGDQPRLASARARLLLGRVLREQGDGAGCVDQCRSAAATLESMGASRQAAAVWRELGDLYRDLGRAEIAIDAYDRALRAVRIAPVVIDVVTARRTDAAAGQREGDMAST